MILHKFMPNPDTQKQTMETWEDDFAKLMVVEAIGNIKFMRSNNFLVAVGFIRTQIMLAKEEEREKVLQEVTVGAIPETNDYANGWNDCRHQYGAIKKQIKERT